MKIISWNLLRLTGAGVEDVAALIEQHRPDLLLLQEATEELAELPARVGGCFFREPLDGRIYGLAVWSPHPLARPYALPLPASQVPGRVPERIQMPNRRRLIVAFRPEGRQKVRSITNV